MTEPVCPPVWGAGEGGTPYRLGVCAGMAGREHEHVPGRCERCIPPGAVCAVGMGWGWGVHGMPTPTRMPQAGPARRPPTAALPTTVQLWGGAPYPLHGKEVWGGFQACRVAFCLRGSVECMPPVLKGHACHSMHGTGALLTARPASLPAGTAPLKCESYADMFSNAICMVLGGCGAQWAHNPSLAVVSHPGYLRM